MLLAISLLKASRRRIRKDIIKKEEIQGRDRNNYRQGRISKCKRAGSNNSSHDRINQGPIQINKKEINKDRRNKEDREVLALAITQRSKSSAEPGDRM